MPRNSTPAPPLREGRAALNTSTKTDPGPQLALDFEAEPDWREADVEAIFGPRGGSAREPVALAEQEREGARS